MVYLQHSLVLPSFTCVYCWIFWILEIAGLRGSFDLTLLGGCCV